MRALARHGRLAPSSVAKTLLGAVAMVLAVTLVSASSVVAIAVWSLSRAISDNAVDLGGDAPLPTVGVFSGGFTVLIVGADNDPTQGAEYGERKSTLNDVNILLHVSEDHSNAVAVSLPRDLVIRHPECTDPETEKTYGAMSAQPLNEAWARGGLSCVVKTVSNLTGLDIPYAVSLKFESVVKITDAIGGVSVCLTAPLDDPYVTGGLRLPAGYSEISGQQAIGFLRSRHGVGDGSDLSRISSQQQYLSSLARKVKSEETLTDLRKLYSLATVIAQNVQVSTSLSNVDTMVSMAQALRSIDLNQLVFVRYPITSDPRYPQKVVPLQSQADELFAKIKADEPFALPDDAAGPGSETVAPDATPEDGAPSSAPPASAPPCRAASPSATPTATPDTIDGLTGTTGQQETCAVPSGE